MEEFKVKNAWIQKQKNSDIFTLWILDENTENCCLYFTMEQLKKLDTDIKNRIKKYWRKK